MAWQRVGHNWATFTFPGKPKKRGNLSSLPSFLWGKVDADPQPCGQRNREVGFAACANPSHTGRSPSRQDKARRGAQPATGPPEVGGSCWKTQMLWGQGSETVPTPPSECTCLWCAACGRTGYRSAVRLPIPGVWWSKDCSLWAWLKQRGLLKENTIGTPALGLAEKQTPMLSTTHGGLRELRTAPQQQPWGVNSAKDTRA